VNIFIRELRANFKSLLIWSAIVIVFNYVGFSKFSAYYHNPEMLAILNTLPAGMVAAMNLSAFNLTTLTGFYGIMVTYFSLMLAIAAAMWGSDIISKEERDKTVEFSLTMPVTRSRVVTAKALAALVNCIGLLLISWGASLAGAASYHPDSAFYTFLALCMAALFVVELVFLAIGIFLGCAMKQYRRAGSLALTVLLVTYILSVLIALNKNLDFLKYLSPFTYFNAITILTESRVDLGFVGLSLAIIVASMVGAYLTYNRRDLYI
jgi:ABC-2 type transport system permease protein